MAFKVVVSQKEVTHQIEVEDGKALNGLVIGDEFERLDEIIKQNKDFQFYFDYTHNFFKLNPLIPRSQTFLIEDNKILCGSPLDNKMIMNIFIDYIKN